MWRSLLVLQSIYILRKDVRVFSWAESADPRRGPIIDLLIAIDFSAVAKNQSRKATILQHFLNMPSKIRAALDAKIDKWRHMRGSSGAGSNLGSAATLSPSPSSGPSPSPSPGPPPSSSPGPSSGPSPSPSPGPPPSPSPSPQSPGQSQVLLGRPPQLPVVVLSRVATIVTFSSEAIWDEAVQALSDDHRFALQKNNFTYPGTDCAIVKQAVKEKQIALERNSNSKRWASYSYTWRGRTYSLTKLLDNTIAWVDRFKTIGDIIAQYDPGHIALPWAAVRFLLQVSSHTYGLKYPYTRPTH